MKVQKILVSQAEPSSFEKSPLNDLSQKNHFEILFQPFTAVEKATLKEFRASRVDFHECNAVIFTSRHAIDHYFALAQEARAVISEEMKYFCTTETVALYLQKYIVYRKRKVFFGAGTFSDLVVIMAKHKDLTYMLPYTDQIKQDSALSLTNAGIKFKPAYITKTVYPDLSGIDMKSFDLIAVYSAKDMKALAEYAESYKEELKIAASGRITAKTALEAGFKVALWAPSPKFPSMVAAIDQYCKESTKNHSLAKFELKSMDEFPASKPAK